MVSLPPWEQIEDQSRAYYDRVLPPDVLARVAVHEASTCDRERYLGRSGALVGMHSFGEWSA